VRSLHNDETPPPFHAATIGGWVRDLQEKRSHARGERTRRRWARARVTGRLVLGARVGW
jgi:hypothetical protein